MNTFIVVSTGIFTGIAAGSGIAFFKGLFKKKTEEPDLPNTSFLFSGNLKQTSIVDAIQFLEIGKKEGILHIYSGRRKGYISFSRGKVIDAFYRDKTVREAIFAMLELEEGDFYFESKEINQPQLISDSIMDLVMTWDSNREG